MIFGCHRTGEATGPVEGLDDAFGAGFDDAGSDGNEVESDGGGSEAEMGDDISEAAMEDADSGAAMQGGDLGGDCVIVT